MAEARPQGPATKTQKRKKLRSSRSMPTTTICWACALLLLFSIQAEAASLVPRVRGATDLLSQESRRARRTEYVTNADSDRDQATGPGWVRIQAFHVQLAPTPDMLSDDDVEDLHDVIEAFLQNYVRAQVQLEGMSLEYVMLADLEEDEAGRGLQDTPSTTLSISAGVASFDGDTHPSASELAALIAEGIESDLPDALSSTRFSYIETATYISLTDTPTTAPLGVQAAEASEGIDTPQKSYVSAGVIGGFIAVAIGVAFLLVRRQRGAQTSPHIKMDDETKDIETTSDPSFEPVDDFNDEHINRDENLSLDTAGGGDQFTRDDSSMWTMSTLPDDAGTVMTFGTSAAPGIHRAESFERDRRISLKKDMLNTSPSWNIGESSVSQPRKKNDDTVLKPSHFGKNDEYKEARSSKEARKNGVPFRFEANGEGEEVYLMPPSETNPRQDSTISFQIT